jgi:APA family basic amino acid/polyamine antiporter
MALSTRVAAVLTGLKLLALVVIATLPLFAIHAGAENWRAPIAASDSALPGALPAASLLAVLAPIMASVMWTYDGWSDVGAIAGEVRDPTRNLLRIYVGGTAIVTGLYLAVNAAYLFLIPLGEMAKMQTVAPAALATGFGSAAALIAAAIVVGSTFGSTHASIMTGARVSFQQSRDGLLFSFLGRVHPRLGTPSTALWTQLALSILAVIFVGSFEALSAGYVFSMWIFYGLAGLALFILRVRRPDAVRPYRCWGYPIVPLLFVASAVFMTVLAVRDQPVPSAQYLGLMLLGAPAYLVWKWRASTARTLASQ